ncbi:MAG: ABC transporter ATP-binding protein [Candidatus Korarchaeum sp.]|nr:ABC transporter ATP-binding protein [Candidatus Korarchaeum sp.]MDW8035668.1 ABC transporter ATP-binding protein [Candidatus Korarchaeum sp.]
MSLEIKELDAGYEDLQVLWGVNMRVEKGEIVSLLGSNGAGKTTTLRVIAGLIKPFKGEILFKGEKITELPSYKRVALGLSLVPEGRQLFPMMTVMENLEMGAYTPRAREKFRDGLEWVFSLFPILKERRNQLAGTMSGGEQQMLAIARALMSRPELLALDEPSMGLAPKFVSDIFRTLRKMRDEGVTILLAEQNVRAALEISDRAYIIETGKVVIEGISSQLIEMEDVKKAYLGL